MGFFDKFKKKDQPIILWKKMDLIPGGMCVGDYVRRILKDNNKCIGYIYLNDDPIGFAYGNLSDIIDPNLYGNLVKEIYGSEEDGVVYYKLVF